MGESGSVTDMAVDHAKKNAPTEEQEEASVPGMEDPVKAAEEAQEKAKDTEAKAEASDDGLVIEDDSLDLLNKKKLDKESGSVTDMAVDHAKKNAPTEEQEEASVPGMEDPVKAAEEA